jgi:hypothetical protein
MEVDLSAPASDRMLFFLLGLIGIPAELTYREAVPMLRGVLEMAGHGSKRAVIALGGKARADPGVRTWIYAQLGWNPEGALAPPPQETSLTRQPPPVRELARVDQENQALRIENARLKALVAQYETQLEELGFAKQHFRKC